MIEHQEQELDVRGRETELSSAGMHAWQLLPHDNSEIISFISYSPFNVPTFKRYCLRDSVFTHETIAYPIAKQFHSFTDYLCSVKTTY